MTAEQAERERDEIERRCDERMVLLRRLLEQVEATRRELERDKARLEQLFTISNRDGIFRGRARTLDVR